MHFVAQGLWPVYGADITHKGILSWTVVSKEMNSLAFSLAQLDLTPLHSFLSQSLQQFQVFVQLWSKLGKMATAHFPPSRILKEFSL